MPNLYNLSAARESELIDLADQFLDARRTLKTIDSVPEAVAPTSLAEAYFVQDQMALSYEPIGGWKIGAASPDSEPFYCPMPLAGFAESGALLAGPMHRLRGLEAEIAFRMGSDLPPRSTPYTREEIVAAIASAHPAIEVLESGITKPGDVPRFTMFGDLQIHGGFVYGHAIPNWQSIDLTKESVTITVDGCVRAERTASNPAGTDLLRSMLYLANEAAFRTGGLKKGQFVTTGSWTGATYGDQGSVCKVHFANAGDVSLSFA